ncbi:MAG: general secretion pathway protein G [Hyphomicrobiaceae bacterium]|jgi:general secretion pathway protein G
MPQIGSTPTPRRRREAGFTLIELLVVMSILVLLTSIVAPRVIGYIGSSRLKAAKVQIESLSTSLELYRLDSGRYPSTNEGLAALIRKPTTSEKWNGPYIKGKDLPADPWGTAYHYRSPGKHGAFDIYSLGADGRASGEGENQDVSSW